MGFTDQIRRAIHRAPVSRYRLCHDIGLAESTMSRFMNGKGGMSMVMLDKIAAYLDLHLVSGPRRPSKEA